jgi:hypothetical protein
MSSWDAPTGNWGSGQEPDESGSPDEQDYQQDPVDGLVGGVRRFLEAISQRPTTWRLILLPLDGTPSIVREHVESNRARILERITRFVAWSVGRGHLPADLDVDLCARTLRDLAEEAGRMVLTDPERFTPERYASFVRSIMELFASEGPRPGSGPRPSSGAAAAFAQAS